MSELLCIDRPTLAFVAARLVSLANVHAGMTVLAPNGKSPHLQEALADTGAEVTFDPRSIVAIPVSRFYDRVLLIARPPAETWEVYAGVRLLRPYCGLVAVMRAEVETSPDREAVEFREFVERRGGWFEAVDPAADGDAEEVFVRVPGGKY